MPARVPLASVHNVCAYVCHPTTPHPFGLIHVCIVSYVHVYAGLRTPTLVHYPKISLLVQCVPHTHPYFHSHTIGFILSKPGSQGLTFNSQTTLSFLNTPVYCACTASVRVCIHWSRCSHTGPPPKSPSWYTVCVHTHPYSHLHTIGVIPMKPRP